MAPVRVLRWLVGHSSWIVAGALIAAFLATDPAFRQLDYWIILSRQYFPMAVLALAMTPIILTGGIDLSIGSALVLSSMFVGVMWQDWQFSVPAAIACGVIAGLLCGCGNGLLVVVGVPPLVATLAMRELYRGLAYTVKSGETIDFGDALPDFWMQSYLGLPVSVYGFAVVFMLTYLLVHHTWMGRMLFAIGDNEDAARFAAVPVRSIKFGTYAVIGLIVGLCGAVSVLHYGAARPSGESTLELLVIACVVLGGVRITGGSGHVIGTVLGIVTLIILVAGLQQNRFAEWRDSITGGLLLLVALTNEASARWLAKTPEQVHARTIIRQNR